MPLDAEIKKTSKDWEHAKFQYKFIDVPGMKHENASAEAFEEALRWIGAGLPDKGNGKTAAGQ